MEYQFREVMVGASELRKSTRDGLKGQWLGVGFVTLIYTIVSNGLHIVNFTREYSYYGVNDGWNALLWAPLLVTIVMPIGIAFFFLVICPFRYGFENYFLKHGRGGRATVKDSLMGYNNLGRSIGVTVLTTIFTVLWTLLFIIPGVIAFYRYALAYYISIDNPKKTAMECIRESKRLMKGNKMHLFYLDMTFIGWALLVGLTIGVAGVLMDFQAGSMMYIMMSLFGLLFGLALLLVGIFGGSVLTAYREITRSKFYLVISNEYGKKGNDEPTE